MKQILKPSLFLSASLGILNATELPSPTEKTRKTVTWVVFVEAPVCERRGESEKKLLQDSASSDQKLFFLAVQALSVGIKESSSLPKLGEAVSKLLPKRYAEFTRLAKKIVRRLDEPSRSEGIDDLAEIDKETEISQSLVDDLERYIDISSLPKTINLLKKVQKYDYPLFFKTFSSISRLFGSKGKAIFSLLEGVESDAYSYADLMIVADFLFEEFKEELEVRKAIRSSLDYNDPQNTIAFVNVLKEIVKIKKEKSDQSAKNLIIVAFEKNDILKHWELF